MDEKISSYNVTSQSHRVIPKVTLSLVKKEVRLKLKKHANEYFSIQQGV
jgi:hypothetical protein